MYNIPYCTIIGYKVIHYTSITVYYHNIWYWSVIHRHFIRIYVTHTNILQVAHAYL